MRFSKPCIELLQEVRERTLALTTDLNDEQLIGPRLSFEFLRPHWRHSEMPASETMTGLPRYSIIELKMKP
jgi:hypothetical protein